MQLPEVYASLKKELVDHFINVNAEYPSAKTHPELCGLQNVPALPAKKSRKRLHRSLQLQNLDQLPKKGRKNAFVAMDSNGNGKVTLEELDGWFKNRAEKNPDKFTYKAEQAKRLGETGCQQRRRIDIGRMDEMKTVRFDFRVISSIRNYE